MELSITIRKARRNDANAILNLFMQYYNFSDIGEAREAFFTEFALHYHFRIAETNGEVVGVMSWRTHGQPKHGIVKIKRIAVSRDRLDRQDLFEMLFDSTIADAEYHYLKLGFRLRKVFTLAPKESMTLQQFLEEKGMSVEAILANHYYDGRDECMYSLFLQSPVLPHFLPAPAAA